MANRAYLFPRDGRDFHGLPARYYDSRHNIPLGWLFFFSPQDLLFLNVGDWQEVKLAAPKVTAVERFRKRRPLLEPYLQDPLLSRTADQLESDLLGWAGGDLLMDPDEIVWDDAETTEAFGAILRVLDDVAPTAAQIDLRLRRIYDRMPEELDARALYVLGTTYTWPDG